MFKSLDLFRLVECPDGMACSLRGCVFSHAFSKSSTRKFHSQDDVEPYNENEGGPLKRRKLSEDHDDTVLAARDLEMAEDGEPTLPEKKQESKETRGIDIIRKYKIKASKPSSNGSGSISPPPLLTMRPHGTISQEHVNARQAHASLNHGNRTTSQVLATTTRPIDARAGVDRRPQSPKRSSNTSSTELTSTAQILSTGLHKRSPMLDQIHQNIISLSPPNLSILDHYRTLLRRMPSD